MFGNRSRGVIVVVIAALGLMVTGVAHGATVPFGPERCTTGTTTAKCDFIRGVAVSGLDGHVFVADERNFRVSEFTAWGEFVKSWGWGVDTGTAALETCTAESACQKGLEGTGPGQFKGPSAIAVDSEGNIYVSDPAAYRIQKFSPDGEFLLMFGGGVNHGPNNPGDVCTAADVTAGDTCGAGTPGAGNGQFVESWSFFSNLTNNIAVGLEDQVYVGDSGRVQEFDSEGNFVRVLPDPDDVIEDKAIGGLAVDRVSGDLYLAHRNTRSTLEPPNPDVFRLNEDTGALIDTLEVEKPAVVAADEDGNVYVFDQLRFSTGDPLNHSTRIFKFDSSGAMVETIAETEIFDSGELGQSFGIATSTACYGDRGAGLYVGVRNAFQANEDFFQAFGPTPDPTPDPALCAPPQVPPSINAQFASSVGEESATVKAEINPHYFTPPVGTTTYYVQWGTAECIAGEGYEGACAKTTPAPPGAEIDSVPAEEDLTTEGVVLEGLAPGTTYRFRFVSEGTGEPGVEIFGVGGEVGVPGTDADFTTQRDIPTEPCPNDSFREQGEGAGLNLRDCRAYELVSPVDKAGGDVQARLNLIPGALEARLDQASVSGDAITFSAYRAFEDPQSAPFSSQYLTRRDPVAGWQTEAISPPQEGEGFINPLYAIDNLYRFFNPDLSQSWLYTLTEPVLDEDALEGEPNVYRRDSVSGDFEACTTVVPLSGQSKSRTYQLQGVSADGDTAAFRLEAKLTQNGSDATKDIGRSVYQAYVCEFDPAGNAVVHLVSVLPGGSASDAENTIGGPANESFEFAQGRTESLENAVSADGSRVFWTASPGTDAESPGALYVRINPAAEQTVSGACDEAGKACTQLIAASSARFWKATPEGTIALYSVGSQLREYNVEAETSTPIASGFLGLVGASEDLNRIYFISENEIDGQGEAGEPNLYLGDKAAETTTLIATLSELDANQGDALPTPGNYEPTYHTARVTPDGSAVAFMSDSAELAELVADYDNTDQLTGLPAAEIYRYSIGAELACVSCNPSGARPTAREIQNTFGVVPTFPAASMLPTWLNALYAPRVLSDDGQRIFFESFEPLSSADVNTKSDVYQWEALGRGSCTEADSAYDSQSAGCISLISSGRSPNDSQFVDASPSGDDVFIRTASSLVGWDPGAIDIYDARVNGGLVGPTPDWTPGQECQGETCPKPPTPPPAAPVPGTGAPTEGNVKAGKPKPRKCRKGTHKVKRKGKVRCVKNKKAKAGKSGRAGR